MNDFVQNVIHDTKMFNEIISLEFLTCEFSNNT